MATILSDGSIAIGPIAKPHIWLEGSLIDADDLDTAGPGIHDTWAQRVDYAIDKSPTSMTTISGVSTFDQANILTFNNTVRVIITGQVSPKFSYNTASMTLPLDSNVFEGPRNRVEDLGLDDQNMVNNYAETWFTINGKDPIRTKAYLWKYRDMDHDKDRDWANKGFLLGSCQTGSDLITIKAKTFYRGVESRIAIAKFKIARHVANNDVVNGVPIEGV